MVRWLQSIGLAVAGIIASGYVFPFRDRPVGGGRLGLMAASEVRIIALVLASIPLGILILLVGASRRFRQSVAPWKAALCAFAAGLVLLILAA